MYTEHNTTQNNLHFTKPQVNELVFMPKLNKTYFCFRVKSVFPGKKTVVATTGVVLLAIVSVYSIFHQRVVACLLNEHAGAKYDSFIKPQLRATTCVADRRD